MKKCGFCGGECEINIEEGTGYYRLKRPFGDVFVCHNCLEIIVGAAYFGRRLEKLKKFGEEFREYVKEQRAKKD